MDWSRAKTILILAFLLLDLFLGFLLWQQKRAQDFQGQVFQLEKESILQSLGEKHITLPEEIPPDAPEMYYWTISPDSKKSITLDKKDVQITEMEDGYEVQFLKKIPLPSQPGGKSFHELLLSKISVADEYFYDSLLSKDEKIVYTQNIDNTPIFSSRLEMRVSPAGWEGYRITYTKATVKGPQRKIISAYSAISVLLENGLLHANERVEEVRVGYIQERYDQDLKLLVPVWRVIHDSGIHYVNGFTGTVMETREGAGGV